MQSQRIARRALRQKSLFAPRTTDFFMFVKQVLFAERTTTLESKLARRLSLFLILIVSLLDVTGCSRSRCANRVARRPAPIASPVISEGPSSSEVPLVLPPASRIPAGIEYGAAYGPVPGAAVAPLGSTGASRDIRYRSPPGVLSQPQTAFVEPRGFATRPQTSFAEPRRVAPRAQPSLAEPSSPTRIRPAPMPPVPANDLPVNVPTVPNGTKRNGNGSSQTSAPNGHSQEAATTTATDEATGIPHYMIVEANVAAGGQPTLDGIKWLKERGFRAILNLLPEDESDPAEASMVRELGLDYVSLPITPSSINRESVEMFNQIVDDAKYRPLFIHDSTGARTGALWYLHRVRVDQVPEDRARNQAARIGLKDSDTDLWLAIQRVISEDK